LNYTHWNARVSSIQPLWIRASVLEFVNSFQNTFKGLLLVSGLKESLMTKNKRWTAKKKKTTGKSRSFIEELVLHNAKPEQDLSVLFF
jgi:hypothetical protein